MENLSSGANNKFAEAIKHYDYYTLDGSGIIQKMDTENVKIDGPIVLVMGGSGTDRVAFVEQYLMSAKSLLGVFGSDAKCISINYNGINKNDEFRLYNLSKMASQIFLPLMSSNGKKIEVEKACKNFRNVTFLSHCLGENWVGELVQIISGQMNDLGYSSEEQDKILDQLFQVSFGIVTQSPKIKTLNVISPYDDMWKTSVLSWYNLLCNLDGAVLSPNDRKLLEEFSEYLYNPNGKKRIYFDISDRILEQLVSKLSRVYAIKNGKVISLASSKIERDTHEHSLKIMDRYKKNWQASEQLTPAGDTVSKILGMALCNSVANSNQNQNSPNLVPFSMDELFDQVNEVARRFNESQEILENNFSK